MVINDKQQILHSDECRDKAICGLSLARYSATRFSDAGAHDPTATYYFVLEELFSRFHFDEHSSLLDVGCGAGRALAHFANSKFPGKATGVELDPELARFAKSWTDEFPNLNVIEGSALRIPIAEYTHFYLFNPFDSLILVQFIAKIEEETATPIELCHMSDNGETFNYMFRPDFSLRSGWTLLDEGSFHMHNGIAVYDHPQHFSFWRFER